MSSYAGSASKWEESSQYLAGGVASSLRASMKPLPIFAESASGSKIRDVDGNTYIDYLLAYGPLILGHAHPVLTEKIHQAMLQGYTYGLQHDGEIQLAKRLTKLLPCAEQVAFSGSGTEAVMLALRLSRAYTGRQKIVRFHGHFHGWSDAIYTSFPSGDLIGSGSGSEDGQVLPGTGGQSHKSLEDIILVPWNEEKAIEDTLRKHGHEIAAVITEPVLCNNGCLIPRPGYLEKLRALTQEHGVVLIFDEVITGFRLGLSGAQGRFGVTPDLMTMGKAMAGGIALSAVAGKRDIMSLISSGKVGHLGTLNGNRVALAAGMAVLDELSQNNGETFIKMENLAEQLADGLRDLLTKHGIPGIINQIGPVFHMMFIARDKVQTFAEFSQRDAAKYALFAKKMLDVGVLVRPSGLWYLSTAHTAEDVDQTLSAADRVLGSL